MTVFVAVSQFSPDRMTYALRTAGDPLRFVQSVHEIVRESDARIPVTNVVTQAAEIDRTISREVTFAKLCTGFAITTDRSDCLTTNVVTLPGEAPSAIRIPNSCIRSGTEYRTTL